MSIAEHQPDFVEFASDELLLRRGDVIVFQLLHLLQPARPVLGERQWRQRIDQSPVLVGADRFAALRDEPGQQLAPD